MSKEFNFENGLKLDFVILFVKNIQESIPFQS